MGGLHNVENITPPQSRYLLKMEDCKKNQGSGGVHLKGKRRFEYIVKKKNIFLMTIPIIG